MNQLSRNNKIIQERIIEVVDNTSDELKLIKKTVPFERVLVIYFNNGKSIENIIINNLATPIEINGQKFTKEERLLRQIMLGEKNLLLRDYDNMIIRTSNIIKVEPKWVRC